MVSSALFRAQLVGKPDAIVIPSGMRNWVLQLLVRGVLVGSAAALVGSCGPNAHEITHARTAHYALTPEILLDYALQVSNATTGAEEFHTVNGWYRTPYKYFREDGSNPKVPTSGSSHSLKRHVGEMALATEVHVDCTPEGPTLRLVTVAKRWHTNMAWIDVALDAINTPEWIVDWGNGQRWRTVLQRVM